MPSRLRLNVPVYPLVPCSLVRDTDIKQASREADLLLKRCLNCAAAVKHRRSSIA